MIPYRIKKTDLLDDIILLVMICHVMFFRWLGLDNVVNLLLTVLLALDFILNARYESKDTFVFYLTALFLYFAFIAE